MLKSLKIENFRCFQTFELQKLGRVNLLVGNNNSGKTSILEAIQLLSSKGNLKLLTELLDRRGEYFWDGGKTESSTGSEFDISHLFYSHQVKDGKYFSITTVRDNTKHELPIKFSASVLYDSEIPLDVKISDEHEIYLNNSDKLTRPSRLKILFQWFQDELEEHSEVRLVDIESGFSKRVLQLYLTHPDEKICFISSSSLTIQKMKDLFEQVVLNPEEELIYTSLQTIEPNIERIATVGSRNYRNADRGGFVVRFKGDSQRIPIGSMGDGIWRMLGITLAIANTKDGVLLIDEIDTGLHFSVMTDMWKLILEASKRLNVQVFATTHNSDCWTSLAAVANAENHTGDDNITIHRIERDKSMSVMFNERQMAIAAERGIEVR
jgi:AAA15 family ATPase/GTPase